MLGHSVSHYRLVEKIGHGSMGVVYKAIDTRIDRTVAIKFLSSDPQDEVAQRRFEREVRAASALDHPNVCTVYEAGELDGMPFIAMAYYQGESLKDRMKRGPMAVAEAIDVMLQIAAGLAQTHATGIVHRDLKPANIFITSAGVVKILDFGLAKLTGSERMTMTNSPIGTLAYMAPEYIASGTVDHRVDIWALGVILFEMLTGRLPFDAEFEQSLLYAIANEQPLPIKHLRPDLDEALVAVVDIALQKDPEQRYQSVTALQDDLRSIAASQQSMEHRPNLVTPATRTTGTGITISLQRWLLLACLTLSTILVLLIPLKIWRSDLLYRQRVLLIIPRTADMSADLDTLSEIAIIMPEHPGAVLDISGKLKYPEVLSSKNSEPRLLARLQPYLHGFLLNHYWRKIRWAERLLDGFFDRLDDISFWNIFAANINAWLLFLFIRQLRESLPRCYRTLSRISLVLFLIWISLAVIWVAVSAYDHKLRAHGLTHGAFWTSNFIPGVRTTQIVDFIVLSTGALPASLLLILKLHFVSVLTSDRFRHLFRNQAYLRAWEYLINSGYFAFMSLFVLALIADVVFHEYIPFRRVGRFVFLSVFLIYQFPFLAISAWAWGKTRYHIDYRFAGAPLSILWISAERKDVQAK